MTRVLFTLLLFTLQACSSHGPLRLYEGPSIGKDQEVTLILPVDFEIVTLNGEPVSQFEQTFRTQDLVIRLAPGHHTLVLQYSNIWEIDSENHDTLTSGKLTFSDELAAGQTYKIDTPALLNYDQAKAFVANPKVSLVSESQSIKGFHTPKSDPLHFSKDDKTLQVNYPNLRQLKFWWENANQYERNQFKQWLQEQH